MRRLPDVRELCFGLRTAWVHKTGNARLRTELQQQFQSLRDQAKLDRVASDDEYDRDGRCLSSLRRRDAADREDWARSKPPAQTPIECLEPNFRDDAATPPNR